LAIVQYQFKNSSKKFKLTSISLTVMAGLLLGLVLPQAGHSDTAESLPLMGDPVSAIISPADEIILGRAYLRALRSQMPIILDPALNNYVEQLITRIIAASEGELPPVQLAMFNSSAINAFAVPGGILGINAGLLLYTTTEAELAAVLAHELAHLSQRHYARGIEHREKTKWATYAGLLASVALLATTDSSTGIASILATQAATIDANLQFSRQNEREADRVGMESLYNAQFDPRAMPAFFSRLLASKQFSGTNEYEFLNTHPVTQSRISDSQARADQLTTQIMPLQQSTLFQFMQARIKAAYASTPQEAISQYRTKLKNKKHNLINRYGLARAYIRNQQFEKALDTILNQGKYTADSLQLDAQTELQFGLVEIEIYLEQEEFTAAKTVIERLQDKYPSSEPLEYYRAKSHLGLQQDQHAADILNDLLRNDPENLLYLRNLLTAERNLYDQTKTLLTQARISFAHGQYSQAKQHYRQALDSVSANNLSLQAKIKQEIIDINTLERRLQKFSG